MAKEKIRVKLKSYDHTLVDAAAAKVVEVAKRNGGTVSGPIPLPTDREVITILRAVHKYKDSREQFETRTHKRLVDILNPQQKTIEALMSLEVPAGVEFEIKAEASSRKGNPNLTTIRGHVGAIGQPKIQTHQPITNGGKNEKRHYR